MARQENPFALLGDDDGDDLTTLLANVAVKVAPSPATEKKKQRQPKNQQSQSVPSAKFPSKPLPPADSVKAERGRGRGGRGRGSGRAVSGGNDAGQFGDSQEDGNQWNSGGVSDGNAFGDSWHGPGRGRGRGFNEDRGFGNEGQVYGGNENQGQGGDGWEEGSETRSKVYGRETGSLTNENRPFGNRNWNAGGERRGYSGENREFTGGRGRDGMRYGRNEGLNGSEHKEDLGDGKEQTANNWSNNNGGGEWDVPETREIPRDVDLEEGKPKQLVSQDIADKKVPEDEENEMTLDEYEKLCFEKRKALEALKNEERKVTPDKDFELMKLVEKKKEENLFIKLKSEKDKLKNKDSLEKEEKVRKSVTIKEFLKPAEGENYIWPTARGRGGRGRGRVERGGHREGFLGLPGIKAAPAPCIEDPDQFPLLGEL